ncbi:MAG: SRPBCC domain-containing protein [Methylobacteriaceae bacterium]|nr:SRPBCC domain-containing protein [Methylobacteriaceae bacterium]
MAEGRSADPTVEPAQRVLAFTRVFDAPRALVYDAFVNPEHALKWMGPRSHPVVHIEGDVRSGGQWRACLRAADGSGELWQGGVYREVVPGERLVFTFAWDEEGGRSGPEMLITITFADQGKKTLMTFRQAVFDTEANRDGHRTGWNSAFDRLADFLLRP